MRLGHVDLDWHSERSGAAMRQRLATAHGALERTPGASDNVWFGYVAFVLRWAGGMAIIPGASTSAHHQAGDCAGIPSSCAVAALAYNGSNSPLVRASTRWANNRSVYAPAGWYGLPVVAVTDVFLVLACA
jgi:hypothetical protein